MKRMNKILSFVIILISFCFITDVKAVYSDSSVGTYEQELAKFPSSYKSKIETLHKL